MKQLTDMAIAALRYFDEHPQSHGWEYERKYVSITGVVPDWIERLVRGEHRMPGAAPMHKYEVLHAGRVYTTVAKSDKAAINFVRFKIYGLTPARDLPPFSAHLISEAPASESRIAHEAVTKADVAERLARMRRSI